MLNKLKTVGLAAAIAVAAPVAAMAATISGQIDISGLVNLDSSDFSVGGNADLEPMGLVLAATGDFGAAGLGFGDVASFVDIDFAAPGAVWTAGIFTFTATGFSNINTGNPSSFTASGIVSAAGYDDTAGTLSFSTQNVGQKTNGQVSFSTTTVVPLPAGLLLMGTALAGLGMTRRKKA